ncbi:MAG: DNA polymerase III subunit alpha [Gracilimonas sp.]|uniref:DNA polymerase III subunit alpha n=1 Tax=Gracilimonas sp. TaxID=1974203 RepID=UPI00199C8F8D|nr:DNA polymerase III subunit alpha [Gracilimonas sp.]MBD3615273.1 DNA polymerase III subunit alpha [Gracilimonas sp.]
MYLIFDTETTGLPQDFSAPITDLDNWPRLVQLAWQLHDHTGKLLNSGNYIVKPEGFTIPFNSEKIHGISTERAHEEGVELDFVLKEFSKDINNAYFLIGHNVSFDEKIMGAEYLRKKISSAILDKPKIDTKIDGTDVAKIEGGRGGNYKWPSLGELHHALFDEGFEDAHDAAADVEATARIFLEMVRTGATKINFPMDAKLYESAQSYMKREEYIDLVSPSRFKTKQSEEQLAAQKKSGSEEETTGSEVIEQATFTHLHNHSKYSVLQATAGIKELVSKAKDEGMNAVGLADLGNMYGAFAFAAAAHNEGIKPIIGCEFYVVEDRLQKKFTRDNKDRRYQIPMFAKNQNGYKNLSKLSSIGFTEGYYYKYPRIDKEVIAKYSKDVICLSGGVRGWLADLILNKGQEFAEEELQWWMETFGDDFYLEVLNHELEEEKRVNEVFKSFSEKYGVKLVATNNVFYLEEEDAKAHDALICIDDGELMSTPKGKGRDFRYGFPNDEFYFKTQEQMKELFVDMPEAIASTQEIVDKIEPIKLEREVILPNFELPEGFETEDEYLRHLTYEGAKPRYKEIDDEVTERIERELGIIEKMGFAGYFLIVQDFIAAARDMGVYVGPGRGSAAGSVVAYCTGITNIDPLEYDLLFERFLNPERVSMPDIDIDFDDDGRQRVIEYVVNKYGKDQVAHIITFGSMAARSSVRDVARVLDLPLSDADRIAKLVPERPGTTLDDAFSEVKELRQIRDGEGLEAETLRMAQVLEGSVRNTGIHAAGIIIAPDKLTEYIPVSTAKDADLYVTQFDGSVIENAGMLKMDFLGLKTLSILKTAIGYVKENFGKEYDLDTIPLNDEKTYKLFQQGGTSGIFQFESEGMRKHLKNLKPTGINDLIAMNALYRPGPMQFIPDYIERKHGREKVEYDHEDLIELLEPTYGIMIYQEQIMKVAQRMGGYSLGEADVLRRIMGKKKPELLPPEEEKFVKQAVEKGYDEKTAKQVFDKMAMFAGYGFNKSHSAAYSVVAYHTMYFKANYPAEYMAAVMTHNMSDIKKVAAFIEECQRMNIPVDPPNINTARGKFRAKDGRVQYGMSAIKGVGSSAIQHIVEEREENGDFASIFDFSTRVDLKVCNRKTLESLIIAGAFDTLNENRAQLHHSVEDILSYAVRKQEEIRLNQGNLFGGESGGTGSQEPKLREVSRWTQIERLNKERELIGFYLSGHPLSRFKEEIRLFGKQNLSDDVFGQLSDRSTIRFIAIITGVKRVTDKKGRPFAFLQVEDLNNSTEVIAFSKTYDQYMGLLQPDNVLFIDGVVDTRGGEPKVIANSFERVENLREKFQEQLNLRIDLKTSDLKKDDLKQVETLFSLNKGNTQVRFSIHSKEANAPIRMNVRNFVVEPNDELLRGLRDVLGEEAVQLVHGT